MKSTTRLQEGALSARKTPAPPVPTKLISVAATSTHNASTHNGEQRDARDKQ